MIRARGLQSKAGSKVLPAPWVKVRETITTIFTPIITIIIRSILSAVRSVWPRPRPLPPGGHWTLSSRLDDLYHHHHYPHYHPLFQQQLLFHERYGGCVLQITVWGDYGRCIQQ